MPDFESIVYNADGLWVDNTAFSFLNEEDEYNENDEKVYFVEWFTEDGLTYTVKFTDTALKNAKIIDSKQGVIEVIDVDGKPVTIQILYHINFDKMEG